MATASLLLSGGWRVSQSYTSGSDVITKLFSSTNTISTWAVETLVTLPGVSTYTVSLATAPQAIILTATGTVRVNFTGQASSFSAASASVMQFREFFAMVAGSTTLPSAFAFANSGTDSATISILVGQ